MNPRRMEAETIRDAVLYQAGLLDLTMGGPDIDENQALSHAAVPCTFARLLIARPNSYAYTISRCPTIATFVRRASFPSRRSPARTAPFSRGIASAGTVAERAARNGRRFHSCRLRRDPRRSSDCVGISRVAKVPRIAVNASGTAGASDAIFGSGGYARASGGGCQGACSRKSDSRSAES